MKRCKTKLRVDHWQTELKNWELILQIYFILLKELKLLEKKQLRYRERNREERIKYYQKLRNLSKRLEVKALC